MSFKREEPNEAAHLDGRGDRQSNVGDLSQVSHDEVQVARRPVFEVGGDLNLLNAEDTAEFDPELELFDLLVVLDSVQQTLVALEGIQDDADESQLLRSLVRLTSGLSDGVLRVVVAFERLGVVLCSVNP